MASTRFMLSPAINLPFSVKASTITPQSAPFPLLNYPSFRNTLKRNVAAASVSGSNAVSEQLSESVVSDSSQDSQATLSPPSSSKLVLVVGGTGGVGQLVVASLLDRNIKARLLLRNLEKGTTLFGQQDEDKLQVVQGDTRNPEDLDPSIFEGVTHVICCTGTTAFPSRRWDGDNTPERVDWDGVRNLVSALPSTLKRIVLVSSVGVTKFNELPWRYLYRLINLLADEAQGSPWHQDLIRVPIGPITRARSKRFKEDMANLVLEIWSKELEGGPSAEGGKKVVNWLSMEESRTRSTDPLSRSIDRVEGVEIQGFEVGSSQGKKIEAKIDRSSKIDRT